MANPFDATNPTTPAYYSPSKTALLLLDFHSFFVDNLGGPSASAALNVASSVRTWAKARNIVVVHALIDVEQPVYPTCKGAETLSGFMAMMKSRGADESASLLDGRDTLDATFLRTPGYVSALKSPGLLDFLQEKGIQSLILTGLSTSGCVLRTAVPATDAGFVVTVLSDACADQSPELHDVLMDKVLPSRAHVITAAEFLQGYGG